MFESDQAWNEEYKALKTLPGRSLPSVARWAAVPRPAGMVPAQDQVEERLSRLYGYASCKGDEDTGNSFYQDMRGKKP